MNVYLLRLIAALTYNRFKNKNMKKIFNLKNFLMASVLLLVTVPANADTSPETKSRVKNSTQKSISDYFRVPGFILPVLLFILNQGEGKVLLQMKLFRCG